MSASQNEIACKRCRSMDRLELDEIESCQQLDLTPRDRRLDAELLGGDGEELLG